ncbi:MAG: M15 family metallopeptidase, partial [Actinobacteria bacterium]|nr:M15 family metallopeptidase [Actinomycetota bacterium]
KGLSRTVRRDEYAGCFNPRFIAGPAGRLSRHSWGLAADLNTSGNAFGQRPHQPRRLVKIMRKWGFTWGGRWPLPDGMHFEWFRRVS